MVARSSHSSTTTTTCSDPNLCYVRLIKQCVTCPNRTSHARPSTSCNQPGLCFNSANKQCVTCPNRSNHSGNSTSCTQPGLCYDQLIKQCVNCGLLRRGIEETTPILSNPSTSTSHKQHQLPSSTTQIPALLTAEQICSALIFGVYALVGLVLAIAAVLWFITQKHKRRQRKRQADKDSEENKSCTISLENQVHKEASLPGEDDPPLLRCPYSNGTAKTVKVDILKENVDSTAVAETDVFEPSSLPSYYKKCNHTFPLPATELGATVLVTTKTTRVLHQ